MLSFLYCTFGRVRGFSSVTHEFDNQDRLLGRMSNVLFGKRSYVKTSLGKRRDGGKDLWKKEKKNTLLTKQTNRREGRTQRVRVGTEKEENSTVAVQSYNCNCQSPERWLYISMMNSTIPSSSRQAARPLRQCGGPPTPISWFCFLAGDAQRFRSGK